MFRTFTNQQTGHGRPPYRTPSNWKSCDRTEKALAAIDGREVSVVGYRTAENSGNMYTVALESKSPLTFECFERELRPIHRRERSECDDPYAVIRNMLSCYLHQDFDLQHDSVADAIHAGIRHADKKKLAIAIEQLEHEPEQLISNVLGDHDVSIWDETTPRELLVTIKTLVKLS